MKIYLLIVLTVVLTVCNAISTKAINTEPIQNAVLLSAYVSKEPRPQITIRWEDADASVSTYTIKKKMVNENSWSELKITDKLAQSYKDTDVVVGQAYEYQVTKIGPDNKGNPDYKGYGFICSGIELPAVESRGNLLLLVDKTFAQPLEAELKRFESDLTGDGWKVVRLDVPRCEEFNPAAVQNIKKRIKEEYEKEPGALKSVILFGRVAIPYSGTEPVDGHNTGANNHSGAWPADVYYADMTGTWTDSTAISTSGTWAVNHNVPLDGKFDQNVLPGTAVLEIGRIDLFNLPSFKETELELMRNYLDKDHNFRSGITQVRYRGLINDRFKMDHPDSFASDAWMNFSPLLGISKTDSGKRLQDALEMDSYLWSYGCANGSFNSVENIIYSFDLAVRPLNGVFIMLLGSYLPDWNSEDNILRAAIASSPSMLTSCFAGRPFWHLHHMAMGWPIGYSTMITQNNFSTYQTDQYKGTRGIHIALMGDPTLRMQVVTPPSDISLDYYNVIDDKTATIRISWKASGDDITGYNVYKADGMSGDFKRLNNEPVTETSFTDPEASRGNNVYMVRAIKLEATPSGTFYNLSQGVFFGTDTILSVKDKSSGDQIADLHASPNPASESVSFYFNNANAQNANIAVFNLNGEKIKDISSAWISPGAQKLSWDLTGNNGERVMAGLYMLKITTPYKTHVAKFIVNP